MVRRHTVITEEFEGVDCELSFEPVEYCGDFHKQRVGDMIVMGYLVLDNDNRDVDDMIGDGAGKLYSFHRHALKGDHDAALKALGNTPDGEKNLEAVWERHEEEATNRYVAAVRKNYRLSYITTAREGFDMCRTWEHAEDILRDDARGARWDCVMFHAELCAVLEEMWEDPKYFPGDRDVQLLACYDHGNQIWSLSGDGMQCRWDTSNQAGVWVPDQCLREDLESIKDDAQRAVQARKECKQFLETYNAIINGDVYGVVVEWFDQDGKLIDNDHCWKFIGGDYALQMLKESFDEHVEVLQQRYDKEVFTQGGRQMEIGEFNEAGPNS